jgi:hypothetical protein
MLTSYSLFSVIGNQITNNDRRDTPSGASDIYVPVDKL